MIEQRIEAVYENGVLRPLAPVDLAEHQQVSIIIGAGDDEELSDSGDESLGNEDEDSNMSWEEVRQITAKLPGSLAEDVDREREERF